MKIFSMVLMPAVIGMACTTAGAQVNSDSVQDHTFSGGQRNNPQPTPASPLNPLLGAPQDDAENDLPDKRTSGQTQGHSSTQGSRTRNQQTSTDAPPSPLLGAPTSYEDSYISSLDYGPEKQTATREASNYKLTPVELLLAPEIAERAAAGAPSHHHEVGTVVADEHQQSQESAPSTSAPPVQASASRHVSLSGTAGSDAASAIYRSPW